MTSNASLKNMTFDQLLDSRIDVKLEERLDNSLSTEPELITIAEAAKICDVDVSVINSLFHKRDKNGFPGIRLSERKLKIDKQRLIEWLRNGGLADGVNK